MGAIAVAAGAALLTLTAVDLMWTTLAASGGGGPLTGRLAHWLWKAVRRGAAPRSHRLLRLGGFSVVVAILLAWIVLLWAGWTLVFHGAGDAVVAMSDGRPAGSLERLYFAGTTISTLGPGDFVPGGTVWAPVAAVASMTGLVAATLSITWLIPVIRAVTHRRRVALHIGSLGRHPQDIVATPGTTATSARWRTI